MFAWMKKKKKKPAAAAPADAAPAPAPVPTEEERGFDFGQSDATAETSAGGFDFGETATPTEEESGGFDFGGADASTSAVSDAGDGDGFDFGDGTGGGGSWAEQPVAPESAPAPAPARPKAVALGTSALAKRGKKKKKKKGAKFGIGLGIKSASTFEDTAVPDEESFAELSPKGAEADQNVVSAGTALPDEDGDDGMLQFAGGDDNSANDSVGVDGFDFGGTDSSPAGSPAAAGGNDDLLGGMDGFDFGSGGSDNAESAFVAEPEPEPEVPVPSKPTELFDNVASPAAATFNNLSGSFSGRASTLRALRGQLAAAQATREESEAAIEALEQRIADATEAEDYELAGELEDEVKSKRTTAVQAAGEVSDLHGQIKEAADAASASLKKCLVAAKAQKSKVMAFAQETVQAADSRALEEAEANRVESERLIQWNQELEAKQAAAAEERAAAEARQAALDAEHADEKALPQTSRDEAQAAHDALTAEIAELEALLATKRQQQADQAARVAAADLEIATIDSAFAGRHAELRSSDAAVLERVAEVDAEQARFDAAKVSLEAKMVAANEFATDSALAVARSQNTAALLDLAIRALQKLGATPEAVAGGLEGAGDDDGTSNPKLVAARVAVQSAGASLGKCLGSLQAARAVVLRATGTIAHIEAELPRLEKLKKAAAAARKFKEAGEKNKEIKKLQADLEAATAEKSGAEEEVTDLAKQEIALQEELTAHKATLAKLETAARLVRLNTQEDVLRTLKGVIAAIKHRRERATSAADQSPGEEDMLNSFGMDQFGNLDADSNVGGDGADPASADVGAADPVTPAKLSSAVLFMLETQFDVGMDAFRTLAAQCGRPAELKDPEPVEPGELFTPTERVLGEFVDIYSLSPEELSAKRDELMDKVAELEEQTAAAMEQEDYDLAERLEQERVQAQTLQTQVEQLLAGDTKAESNEAGSDAAAASELDAESSEETNAEAERHLAEATAKLDGEPAHSAADAPVYKTVAEYREAISALEARIAQFVDDEDYESAEAAQEELSALEAGRDTLAASGAEGLAEQQGEAFGIDDSGGEDEDAAAESLAEEAETIISAEQDAEIAETGGSYALDLEDEEKGIEIAVATEQGAEAAEAGGTYAQDIVEEVTETTAALEAEQTAEAAEAGGGYAQELEEENIELGAAVAAEQSAENDEAGGEFAQDLEEEQTEAAAAVAAEQEAEAVEAAGGYMQELVEEESEVAAAISAEQEAEVGEAGGDYALELEEEAIEATDGLDEPAETKDDDEDGDGGFTFGDGSEAATLEAAGVSDTNNDNFSFEADAAADSTAAGTSEDDFNFEAEGGASDGFDFGAGDEDVTTGAGEDAGGFDFGDGDAEDAVAEAGEEEGGAFEFL
eukprot:INCI5518.1.p1 GENE.INCI5518.1~~INCI5518.1.p1  ORF type:complete len:1376 (+),score=486.44 INCI5518.1:274-4401(+)